MAERGAAAADGTASGGAASGGRASGGAAGWADGPELAVVIVTYRSAGVIGECLAALPAIDLGAEFGPNPDPDDIYDHLIRVMQSTLDALAKETSALSLAAERGRHALVRALIDAGAGVRKPEIGGRALQLAAQQEHVDVARTLMEAKAPLGFSPWESEPPLHAA